MYPLLRKLLAANHMLKVFVGIGNVLHRDDGVGVYIARKIRENQHIRVINAEVSIENYIGKVNAINPAVIILIDSMFFGREPGYSQLLSMERLRGSCTHTHNISLRMITELFKSEILILGVQPATVSFGEGLSGPVQKKADRLVSVINADYLLLARNFSNLV
jgi:hydrogenase 3 maturation protease